MTESEKHTLKELDMDEELLDDVSFDYKDDTGVPTIDSNISDKYTKIDHLDEDPVIYNQRWALVSFISPEGLMNCKIRGLKIRGVYATEGEAKAASDKLKKKDKYFDIFVAEVGKWVPWDPSLKQVEEVKYQNKKLDKIMSKLHESEVKSLNELVGRRKDMIDKESISHKNRIRNSIKESVDSFNDPESTTSKEEPVQKITKKQHDSSAVKERLQKTLSERKKKENDPSNLEQRSKILQDLDEKKKKLKEETDRVIEKTTNVDSMKKKTTELDNKIKKMKEQFEQKKKQQAEQQAEQQQTESNL